MLDLRPYQLDAIEAIDEAATRDVQRPLVVHPTGAGKTVTFAHLLKQRTGRALVLVHTDELVLQTQAKLKMIAPELSVGVVKAERDDYNAPVVVASVQTASRPNRLITLRGFSTAIVDEAHHAAAPTWRKVLQHVGAFTPGGPLCAGFTATPERSDGGLGDIWQEIVAYRSIREMVYDGYLCEPVGERVDTSADFTGIKKRDGDLNAAAIGAALVGSGAIREIANAVLKYAEDRKTVAFTPTVETARQLAQAVSALGIPAEYVSGETPQDLRRAILRRLKTGQTRFVANCAVLTEGFDEPSVDCIAIARPTASHALYVQMVGRGLRPYPGKANCLVLDVVGATERHDLIGSVDLDTGVGGQSKSAKKKITVGPAVVKDPCALCGRTLSQKLLDVGATRHRNCKAGGTARAQMFAASQMNWLEVETGFCLAAGEETIVIVPTTGEDDLWHVVTYQPKGSYTVKAKRTGDVSRIQTLHRSVPIEWAQGIGEDRSRAFGKLTERTASWRSQRPTQLQLSRLEREGLAPELLPRVKTRGQAADLMTRVQARRALRGVEKDRRKGRKA